MLTRCGASSARPVDDDDDDDDDDDSSSWSWSGSSSSSSSSSVDDDDDDISPETVRAFLNIVFFPWSIPHIVLENSALPEVANYSRCLTAFQRPYAQGAGILRNACDEDTSGEKQAMLALSSESGFMFSPGSPNTGQVQGVVPASFAARLLLPQRLELSGRIDWLRDVATKDTAFMNTAHVVYRFAQSKHVDFRTGLGPRYFKLDVARWGVDLLYGMDVYGRRPIVFRMELHAGFMGPEANTGFAQARGTLGGMIGRAELYAGYDHTYLSDGRGAGVKLGGPIAGVRAWF